MSRGDQGRHARRAAHSRAYYQRNRDSILVKQRERYHRIYREKGAAKTSRTAVARTEAITALIADAKRRAKADPLNRFPVAPCAPP